MFKVETSGETMKVTRTLELPKTGNLPSVTLQSSYKVKFNLGGVKPGSDVGKAVLASFENIYLFELKRFGTRQDIDFVKDWKELGTSLGALKDKEQARKAATAFEKNVLDTWNRFAEDTGRRYAATSFESAVKAVRKDKNADLAKARIDFRADELKASRVNILTTILDAVTFSVGAGPLGWLAAAVKGVGMLLKAYQSAWNIAKTRAGNLVDTLGYVDDRLKEAKKAVDLAAGGVERLKAARSALEAELVLAAKDLDDLRNEVTTLAAHAKKEQAVREGGLLEKLRAEVEARAKALKTLQDDIGDLGRAITAVASAQTAITQADKIVSSERKGWDAVMATVTKHNSDLGTMMSTAATALKSLA